MLALAVVAASPAPIFAADNGIPRIAFFGFSLINTSLEATTPAEERRLHMLDDLLRNKLEASGRFKLVPIPAEIRQEIAQGPAIYDCNGCERDYGRRAGANWAA